VAAVAIRPALEADFPAIWAIFEPIVKRGDTYAYASDTTFEEARAIWTAPPARTFVAHLDERIVGTYVLKPNAPGRGAHVANAGYMVAESARGHGVASAMCAHSIDVARACGFRAMQFNFVVSTNEGAVRLWQRHGFAIVGRLPRAFDHAERGLVDAFVMHRFL
jgi:L-amino acid N-acyltransferase YncA